MRVNQFKNAALLLTAVTVGGVLTSCGGGGGTGSPPDSRTTLRVGVVQESGAGVSGVQGATVVGVYGNPAQPGTLKTVNFAPINLDPTRHDLALPPADLVGIFIIPPAGFHPHIAQYKSRVTGINNVDVYQMPNNLSEYLANPTVYAIAPLTGPFGQGIIDIGDIKIYPSNQPPPQPNFP